MTRGDGAGRGWGRPMASVLAIGLLGALAACGGGDAPSRATPGAMSTTAAVQTLRVRALALGDVAPHEAARQLLDFAETTFAVYFPGRQPTREAAPFVYRHYPETGVYLGVVVSAAAGYELLGVYVMGGPFGAQPQHVGPLARFITPVAPGDGPGPTGTSNGCFDVRDFDPWVPGTRWVQVERSEGPGGGVSTSEWRVTGPVTFEGHAAVETRVAAGPGSFPAGLPDSAWQQADTRVYQALTGPAEVTHYGQTAAISSSSAIPGGGQVTSNSESRVVYDPPWVDRQGQLPLGGSLSSRTRTRTTTGGSTVVTGGPVAVPPVVIPPSVSVADGPLTRVTFVRRETVTVPLGTFPACVYQYDTPSSTGLVWIAEGRGFNLRSSGTSAGQGYSSETLAVTVNGRPLAP